MIKKQQLLLQREPIKTAERGASTVKVERSAAQYLYGAQRAVKSRVGSSRSEEKIKVQFSEDRTATNQQLLVAHRRGCAAGPHCSPPVLYKTVKLL
jgi:hypothetical protein